MIFVKDNGKGIDPDTNDRLFKNNDSLTTSVTEGESGSGLGLLLVKDFVKRLGGEVWVDSIPKEGSTFSFSIPKQKDGNNTINDPK